MRSRLAACLPLAAAAVLLAPAVAGAETKWLCRPGIEDNPCEMSLETTVYAPSGESRVITPPRRPRPIDCFYVYPTVSNQPTPNATRSRDPELVSIARYQAAPFSSRCRVFAPIYRQRTLAALATAGIQDEERAFEIAYGDVRSAWIDYLRHDNASRGVVLIGHSQGTRMLRMLIARELDRDPRLLGRRIVSAILLGGDVIVAEGRRRGGDFRHMPTCERKGEIGCVIAYSTFAEDPPREPRFGQASEPGFEVACTDPGRLAGQPRGPMRMAFPSAPFAPGLILAGTLITYGGLPPAADTPWVVPADRYRGRCRSIGDANVLRFAPLGDSRELNYFPDDSWGTHLVDVNLTFRQLLEIVRVQSRRYCRSLNPASGSCRAPSALVSER